MHLVFRQLLQLLLQLPSAVITHEEETAALNSPNLNGGVPSILCFHILRPQPNPHPCSMALSVQVGKDVEKNCESRILILGYD